MSCQVSLPSSFHFPPFVSPGKWHDEACPRSVEPPSKPSQSSVTLLPGSTPVTSTHSLHHHRSKLFMPSAAARGGVSMWVCVQMWRQIELNLIAFVFAPLTISSKHSNPSSPHLPHHWCHSNVWATNWFSLPRWFPYQAGCQHGRWEALRVALLLQQIWWIAQTVSSSPVQSCSRGGCRGTVQYCGLLGLVFQPCARVVPSVLSPAAGTITTYLYLCRGKSFVIVTAL